jgi:membrane fusion protein, multidrug efflux system
VLIIQFVSFVFSGNQNDYPNCNFITSNMTRILKIHFKALYIFSVVFILNSCGSGGTGASTQQGPRAIQADGYRAETEPFTVRIRTTAELMPNEEVDLRTPVAGNVLKINFEEGQFVQKGALLVQIDSRTWEAQKKGLEAQLVSAQNELERRKQLLQMEGASQEDVDQADARVSGLVAQIEELSVRVDLANIRAPFSGRLGMRNFSPGAFLSQGDVVTRLVQTNQLKVNFTVPARYATLAQVNQTVNVVSSSSRDTTVARVYAVDPFIDPSTRSIQLRAMLNNEKESFLPGDFAQVEFEVEQTHEAILIPAEAIISELNSQVVYIASQGKAQRKQVEMGTRTSGRVHILNGISPGDTVLITGLMEVRDGSNVNVVRLNQEAGL